MIYNADKIAHWFLVRNKSDYDSGITDELISNLKLQKLLYYAQGCVLAIKGEPLFGDDIYAWEHGPVIPAIYHEYKSFGKSGIDFDEHYDISVIDKETNEILEQVYTEFGQYSAWKLRNMTHEEMPWRSTEKNEIISNDVIKKYFMENYIVEQ